MASDNDDKIVNGRISNGDLRPDRLIAPGSGITTPPQPNVEPHEFQSRVLSDLRDIKDALLLSEQHLARLESILSPMGRFSTGFTNYPRQEGPARKSPSPSYDTYERSTQLISTIVPKLLPPTPPTLELPAPPEPPQLEAPEPPKLLPAPSPIEAEPSTIQNGGELVPYNADTPTPIVIPPDTSMQVEGMDNVQKGVVAGAIALRNSQEIIKSFYRDWKEYIRIDEVQDPERNTALVKKGYTDAEEEVEEEPTEEGGKKKLPKWLRGVIGTGVALTGLGELDDLFSNSITNFIYKKVTGNDDEDDFYSSRRHGKRRGILEPEDEDEEEEEETPRKRRGKKEPKEEKEQPKKEQPKKEQPKRKQPKKDTTTEDELRKARAQAKEKAEQDVPPYADFSKMGASRGFDPTSYRKRKEKEAPIIDAEIVEEPSTPSQPPEKETPPPTSSSTPEGTVKEILEDINKNVENIKPLTSKGLEDVLDKQSAEEEQVADMDDRLEGEDIKTDVYEEDKTSKKDEENQKGILDSIKGISTLLKTAGPAIMGVLGTIGTTLAVLGTAVGGFIAGWKLEEYLDAKFDIVNKTLNGIDNTLGTSIFHTEEERREKAHEEAKKNWGEKTIEFKEKSIQGVKEDALDKSIETLAAENESLQKKAQKGDVYAQKRIKRNNELIDEYKARQSELRTEYEISSGKVNMDDLQNEVDTITAALASDTWASIQDKEGNAKFTNKAQAEEYLKYTKATLDKVQKVTQKQKAEEFEKTKLKEGEEYDILSKEGPTDATLKNAWKEALPTPTELPTGEPKLNPVDVPGISNEQLTDLIQLNRKDANNTALIKDLKQGTKMEEAKTDRSKIDDFGIVNGKPAVKEGYRFTESRKKEVKEGDFLHFDPESYTMSGQVIGKEYDIPGLGVLAPGFYEATEGGRTRQDALEDVARRKTLTRDKLVDSYLDALDNAYSVDVEPVVPAEEKASGTFTLGGYTTTEPTAADQAAREELRNIYSERLSNLEQLREGLDNPASTTYLGKQLQEQFTDIYSSLDSLNNNTPLRWERDPETGALSKWAFGDITSMLPTKENPTASWLPSKTEGEIPTLRDYYEWKAPIDWDAFTENPITHDLRMQGLLNHVYPFKGATPEELGDYDLLKTDDTTMRNAWGAALQKAKPTPIPTTFTESIDNYTVSPNTPTVPAKVQQSRSQKEIPTSLSDDVREYEEHKIQLLETLNKNIVNQRKTPVIAGGGSNNSGFSDMRMSIDDVGLTMVNLGIFD